MICSDQIRQDGIRQWWRITCSHGCRVQRPVRRCRALVISAETADGLAVRHVPAYWWSLFRLHRPHAISPLNSCCSYWWQRGDDEETATARDMALCRHAELCRKPLLLDQYFASYPRPGSWWTTAYMDIIYLPLAAAIIINWSNNSWRLSDTPHPSWRPHSPRSRQSSVAVGSWAWHWQPTAVVNEVQLAFCQLSREWIKYEFGLMKALRTSVNSE